MVYVRSRSVVNISALMFILNYRYCVTELMVSNRNMVRSVVFVTFVSYVWNVLFVLRC